MKTPTPDPGWIIQVGACFLVLALVSGCAGTFGHYKRDPEVFEAFNSEQVPLDYRYYYYHSGSEPIAVIGVEKKYDAGSNMWREVEPNTAKFKNLIDWIWEDYGYTAFRGPDHRPFRQAGRDYVHEHSRSRHKVYG